MQPVASPQGLVNYMSIAGHLFEICTPEGLEGKAEQRGLPAKAFHLKIT